MYYLNMLLKKAKSNGNKLNIEDIEKLQIEENEYEKVLKVLSDKGVIIEIKEDLSDKDIAEMVKQSESDERYILSEVKQYLNEIGGYPVLSKEEEIEMFKKYKKGDLKARDWIIKCNLKLVASYAKRYNNRANVTLFYSYLDIIQEGNLGLFRAVEKFDETRGYKFSTYATWWIRRSIEREMSLKERTIRLPIHQSEAVRKLNKYIEIYSKKTGYEPTIDDCANELQVSKERIDELMALRENVISLNTTVGEEDDNELINFIPSEMDLEEQITDNFAMSSIIDAMKRTLTAREYRVLMLRYGLSDGRERTLEEVGQFYNVTRERIRQIESKGLRKIRQKLKYFTKDDIPKIR